jgi:hypothetical protein
LIILITYQKKYIFENVRVRICMTFIFLKAFEIKMEIEDNRLTFLGFLSAYSKRKVYKFLVYYAIMPFVILIWLLKFCELWL